MEKLLLLSPFKGIGLPRTTDIYANVDEAREAFQSAEEAPVVFRYYREFNGLVGVRAATSEWIQENLS